jgi:hypothetical protein
MYREIATNEEYFSMPVRAIVYPYLGRHHILMRCRKNHDIIGEHWYFNTKESACEFVRENYSDYEIHCEY